MALPLSPSFSPHRLFPCFTSGQRRWTFHLLRHPPAMSNTPQCPVGRESLPLLLPSPRSLKASLFLTFTPPCLPCFRVKLLPPVSVLVLLPSGSVYLVSVPHATKKKKKKKISPWLTKTESPSSLCFSSLPEKSAPKSSQFTTRLAQNLRLEPMSTSGQCSTSAATTAGSSTPSFGVASSLFPASTVFGSSLSSTTAATATTASSAGLSLAAYRFKSFKF